MSYFFGPPNCDVCGRFVAQGKPGTSWVFVPESDAPSREEDVWRCADCTSKHGRCLPAQNVVIEKCSGVIGGGG